MVVGDVSHVIFYTCNKKYLERIKSILDNKYEYKVDGSTAGKHSITVIINNEHKQDVIDIVNQINDEFDDLPAYEKLEIVAEELKIGPMSINYEVSRLYYLALTMGLNAAMPWLKLKMKMNGIALQSLGSDITGYKVFNVSSAVKAIGYLPVLAHEFGLYAAEMWLTEVAKVRPRLLIEQWPNLTKSDYKRYVKAGKIMPLPVLGRKVSQIRYKKPYDAEIIPGNLKHSSVEIPVARQKNK
jgi:hypothetical protein